MGSVLAEGYLCLPSSYVWGFFFFAKTLYVPNEINVVGAV